MKVLITGGLGYLGQVIAQSLTGHEIEICDIKDGKDYRDIKRIEADTVVHLAAVVGYQACAINPQKARETNYKGLRSFIRVCKVSGVRRFIFASTCSVYGEDSIATCYETGRINPLSLYATTKYAAERLLLSEETPEFTPVILRFGTAFGQSPAMRYNLVLNKFAKQIREGDPLVIYGGDQFRPFIHVSDIARVIKRVIETPYSIHGIFNIANENVCLKSVGWDIQKWYPTVDVRFSHECTDKRSYRVSSLKAEMMLKFTPQVSIREGIEEMIKSE